MPEKGYRILTIDDSEFMQLMLENILKDSEFKIIARAGNYEEAIQAFNQTLPDLVTIDINMPHTSGLEVLEKLQETIKAKNLKTVCLMVSSANKPQNIEEATKKGASGFLTKPFKPDVLLATLRSAIKERGE